MADLYVPPVAADAAAICAEIEAAWNELTPPSDKAALVKDAVDNQMRMGWRLPEEVRDRRLRLLRSTNRGTAEREIAAVAAKAEAFRDALAALHQPAADAFLASGVDPALWGDAHLQMLHNLVRLSEKAKDHIPPSINDELRGREPNHHANAVAGVTVGYYEKIFGSRIDLPMSTRRQRGGLEKLLTKIFRALRIDGNPKAALAAEVARRAAAKHVSDLRTLE
jgi:hypothetical protein